MNTVEEVQVEGFIVTYGDNHGSVLLRHCSIPSLKDLACRYRSRRTQKLWFASFQWKHLLPYHDNLRANKRQTLQHQLIGRRVVCKVVKDPRWRVISLYLDLQSARLITPPPPSNKGWFAPWEVGKKKSSPKKFNKRMIFATRSGGSNIRRPWGGM